jgi:hypothetical protein
MVNRLSLAHAIGRLVVGMKNRLLARLGVWMVELGLWWPH